MTTLVPTRQELHARTQVIAAKMLDKIEQTLDRVYAPPEEPAPLPLVVERRRLCNLLGVPELCHHRRCRRTKACTGEPTHCLSASIPILPHELLARVLSAKAIRQRVRKRSSW